MSEEALWYAARIAGLMTWILAFGSLCAGLLVGPKLEEPTQATQWASDTHRFLGLTSFLALLVHGSAVVVGERSNLSVADALSGYQAGSWLAQALLVGVVCGWLLVLVETGRAVTGRIRSSSGMAPRSLEAVTTVCAVAVVGGGAYHAWMIGSDTRNPITLIIAGLAAVILVATAALGASALFGTGAALAGHESDPPAGRLDGRSGEVAVQERSLGSWKVSVDAPSQAEPQLFNPQVTVSLSKQVDQPTAPQLAERGPQVTSARDITAEAQAKGESVPPPPQHRKS